MLKDITFASGSPSFFLVEPFDGLLLVSDIVRQEDFLEIEKTDIYERGKYEISRVHD